MAGVNRILLIIGTAALLAACAGKTGDELCAEGTRELKGGNAHGAIVLLKNALEKNQNHREARYQLARAYMAAGKYDQAEKEFQKVQRLDPSRREVRLDQARLYLSLRKPERATELAEDYLKEYPDSAEALETAGTAQAAARNFERAEMLLSRARAVDPARLTASMELADLHARQGRAREAEALLAEVLQRDPRLSRAWYARADLARARGDKDQALEIYRKVAALDPADITAPYRIGLIQLDRGNTAEAESTASAIIKTYPKKAEGYRLQGLVLYQQKNFREAITALQSAMRIQPTMGDTYFLGLSLYHRGELENAMSQFRRLLDRAPGFSPARLLAGMILLRQKHVDEAVAELQKLVSEDGGNAWAHNVLGSAYMAKGMYGEGMKELDTAIRLDPKIVDAHLKKGMFLLASGKNGGFEDELQAAVQVAPELLNTRFILASYYLKRNDVSRAIATLKAGLSGGKQDAVLHTGIAKMELGAGNETRGLQHLAKAKELDGGNLEPYFTQATYFTGKGADGKALQEYAAILGKDPRNLRAMLESANLLAARQRDGEALAWFQKARDTRKPEAYLAIARYYGNKKDFGRGIATLDEGLKHNPRAASLLETKGRLLVQARRFKEALQAFDDFEQISPAPALAAKARVHLAQSNFPQALDLARRAISLMPRSADGYLLTAAVYEKQGDLKRGMEELKKGLETDPASVQAALFLAQMHARTGKEAEAYKTAEDLVRRRPDFAPGYFVQGVLLTKQGKPKEALERYRKAVALDGAYVPALNNLALLYADGYGNREEAVRLARAALLLEPDNPGVIDTVGYALLKNGQAQEARATLEKAAGMAPDDPTVNYHLALACSTTGDRKQALQRLEKALKTGSFPEKHQARELLAKLN